MSIVTFYSYKGGVGRSMALANVALILARRGFRVLAVDWDLEAPGLEEYFSESRINTSGRGLLDLLLERGDYRDYLWDVARLFEGATLHLLPSGRDEETYYPNLEKFSQAEFYAGKGGEFLEQLRLQWKKDYDFVLLDSRTGLSDTSGVCTIHLPDLVVALFTGTLQSVRGSRDVLQLAKQSRQRLDFDRAQFPVIPVPCRLDSRNSPETDKWLATFSQTMSDLMDDWRPRSTPPADILQSLAIPQIPELLYGMPLIEEGEDPGKEKVLQALTRLAGLIESDLRDLSSLKLNLPEPTGSELAQSAGKTEGTSDYKYDIFLSFSHGSNESEWVERIFLPTLRDELSLRMGREPEIYVVFQELSSKAMPQEIDLEVLHECKIFICFVTDRYLRSEHARMEIDTFLAGRSRPHVIPVVLDPLLTPDKFLREPNSATRFPGFAAARRTINFSEFYVSNVGVEKFLHSSIGKKYFGKLKDLVTMLVQILETK